MTRRYAWKPPLDVAQPRHPSLVAFNRKKLLEVADHILEFCRTPIDFEDILQKVFDRYHLTMSFEQYVLVGSTIRSYLAWFRDTGRADVLASTAGRACGLAPDVCSECGSTAPRTAHWRMPSPCA